MKIKTGLIALAIVFAFSFQCNADNEKMISLEHLNKITFNHNFLNAKRDASIFLRSLNLMNSNNSEEVENFLEYMLDTIVCESWINIEKMNEHQKKETIKFLLDIKEYREQHPRENFTIDPTQFSIHLNSFNESYAQQADEILANLE